MTNLKIKNENNKYYYKINYKFIIDKNLKKNDLKHKNIKFKLNFYNFLYEIILKKNKNFI